MEVKDFNDYKVADVTNEDIMKISELEKSISTSKKKNIVLIAYQQDEPVN